MVLRGFDGDGGFRGVFMQKTVSPQADSQPRVPQAQQRPPTQGKMAAAAPLPALR